MTKKKEHVEEPPPFVGVDTVNEAIAIVEQAEADRLAAREEHAELLYTAYQRAHQEHHGLPAPAWSGLADNVKACWREVAHAAVQ